MIRERYFGSENPHFSAVSATVAFRAFGTALVETFRSPEKILKNFIQTVDKLLEPCYYISVIDNDYHY